MSQLTFRAGDSRLSDQFGEVAARSYGHPVADIEHLRDRADLRVAVRNGRVVAGGLGLLVSQFFGGAPVPSACLAAGCVAPEERGNHLAARMINERLAPLREQGAVISTISTAANGHARRLGWQAPVPVLAWTVATDDLRRSFKSSATCTINHGLTHDGRVLHRLLARRANGPVDRPPWWWDWKQHSHALETYQFATSGHGTTGLLLLSTARRAPHGITLTVHDFWAADHDTAHDMFTFLGQHNARAAAIDFRRGALPPHPTLLHNLHRCRMTAHAWHPWMLRILDIPAAVHARGWPADLNTAITIAIEPTPTTQAGRYRLRTSTLPRASPIDARAVVSVITLVIGVTGGAR